MDNEAECSYVFVTYGIQGLGNASDDSRVGEPASYPAHQ